MLKGFEDVQPPLADYQWLVSPLAEAWLQRVAAHDGSITSLVGQLRKQLSPTRTHLVLQQTDLRRRARLKFLHPDRMFFTAHGLEQATDWRLARFKADHFRRFARVTDLCCGIGGDLLELARLANVVGYDHDSVCTTLAVANVAALARTNQVDSLAGQAGTSSELAVVVTSDVLQAPLETVDAWHLDPDRRPRGHRTTDVEQHEPGPETIDQLRTQCPHGAIKLAPVAQVPERWAVAGERQWLGRGRECPQMWLRFGSLCERPGRRSVALVGADSQAVAALVADADDGPSFSTFSDKILRYLHEPHAAVLAADLVDHVAVSLGLSRLAAGLVYLTSDTVISSPLVDSFEVLDVLPLDMKRIKSALRQRNVGCLEVKRRGTSHDPVQLQRQLRGSGCESMTLLLAGSRNQTWAALTRRCGKVADTGK